MAPFEHHLHGFWAGAGIRHWPLLSLSLFSSGPAMCHAGAVENRAGSGEPFVKGSWGPESPWLRIEQYTSSSAVFLFPLPFLPSFLLFPFFPVLCLSFFGFPGSWGILTPISFLIAKVGFPVLDFLNLDSPCRVFLSHSHHPDSFLRAWGPKTERDLPTGARGLRIAALYIGGQRRLEREATPLETHISLCCTKFHTYISRYPQRWQP